MKSQEVQKIEVGSIVKDDNGDFGCVVAIDGHDGFTVVFDNSLISWWKIEETLTFVREAMPWEKLAYRAKHIAYLMWDLRSDFDGWSGSIDYSTPLEKNVDSWEQMEMKAPEAWDSSVFHQALHNIERELMDLRQTVFVQMRKQEASNDTAI